MDGQIPLEDHLVGWRDGTAARSAVADTIAIIADAARTATGILAQGPLAAAGSPDGQSAIAAKANEAFRAALSKAPVAILATSCNDEPRAISAGSPIAVTLDPIMASALDIDATAGTIFSILPAAADSAATFRQPGSAMLAAGYIVFGPHVSLVLTLGAGTSVFTLDHASGRFRSSRSKVEITKRTREYAINASNARHWSDPVRAYMADCVAGKDGPRGEDYNMRWTASLPAECHRIIGRGGIYLYPSDTRPDYREGRLKLVLEANPIAFVVEQAGGLATNGRQRLLEIEPSGLSQRTPFVFGSRNEVERLVRYKTDQHGIVERSPLFGKRGLFRA